MRLRFNRPPLGRALVLAAALGTLWASVALAASGPLARPRADLLTNVLPGLAPSPVPSPPPSPVPNAPGPAPQPPPAPAPSTTPCAGGAIPGDTSITLSSGGFTRSAVLHLPPAAATAGRPLALIVAFHGFGGDGPHFARDSALSTVGDQYGFAVVYPSSLGERWLISGLERDVVFASDLLDRVESLACINHRRVYATGVSIGAGMAARVGCELSDRTAALVLVSGGYRSLPACKADRPLSVLEIHGTSDTTVPYGGRGPAEDGAVLPYISGWATRDHCQSAPMKRIVAAHTVLYRWRGCASGAIVEHLRIYGSGHGLPNAEGHEISSGHRSPISGVRNIWHFLASRTLGIPFATGPDQAVQRRAGG